MGNGFKTFLEETGSVRQAFLDMSKLHSENSSLDRKTNELALQELLNLVHPDKKGNIIVAGKITSRMKKKRPGTEAESILCRVFFMSERLK